MAGLVAFWNFGCFWVFGFSGFLGLDAFVSLVTFVIFGVRLVAFVALEILGFGFDLMAAVIFGS